MYTADYSEMYDEWDVYDPDGNLIIMCVKMSRVHMDTFLEHLNKVN